jgi:hypothetical protein
MSKMDWMGMMQQMSAEQTVDRAAVAIDPRVGRQQTEMCRPAPRLVALAARRQSPR